MTIFDFHVLRCCAALLWPDLVRYMSTARLENVPMLYGRDGQVMIAPDYREMLTVTVFDKPRDESC